MEKPFVLTLLCYFEQVKYRNMCEMMISYVWNLAFIQWLLHSEEKKEDKIGENFFKEVIGISYWTWLFSTTCTNNTEKYKYTWQTIEVLIPSQQYRLSALKL